jgi:hypothetical protein
MKRFGSKSTSAPTSSKHSRMRGEASPSLRGKRMHRAFSSSRYKAMHSPLTPAMVVVVPSGMDTVNRSAHLTIFKLS